MAQTLLDGPDSFNGTNGDTLNTYNAKWVDAGGSLPQCKIAGSPGFGTGGGQNAIRNTGQTWTNNQWAEAKVDGTNLIDSTWGIWMICVRVQGGVDFKAYCGGANYYHDGNNTYRITRYDFSGVRTVLATGTHAMALNDVVNLEIDGTTLTLRVNGSIEAGPVTDSTFATGNPGLHIQYGGTSTNRLGGTWKAGSVTAGGEPPPEQYAKVLIKASPNV